MIRVIRGASLLILCAGASLEAQQVDTIRVGSSVLHGARPPLGSQFTESFARADGVDHPISTTTQGITRGRHGNQDVYVIHTTHASAAGDTTVGTIVIRHPDFALLHHKGSADSPDRPGSGSPSLPHRGSDSVAVSAAAPQGRICGCDPTLFRVAGG